MNVRLFEGLSDTCPLRARGTFRDWAGDTSLQISLPALPSARRQKVAQNHRIAPGLKTSEVEGTTDILGKFDAGCPVTGALSLSILQVGQGHS